MSKIKHHAAKAALAETVDRARSDLYIRNAQKWVYVRIGLTVGIIFLALSAYRVQAHAAVIIDVQTGERYSTVETVETQTYRQEQARYTSAMHDCGTIEDDLARGRCLAVVYATRPR